MAHSSRVVAHNAPPQTEQGAGKVAPKHHSRKAPPVSAATPDPLRQGEVLGRMAHEFRTPLNAILGFAQLLLDPSAATHSNLTPEQIHYIKQILRSGHQLLGVIDATLDIAMAVAGDMPLQRAPLDIATLFAEVTAQLAPLADAREQSFTVAIMPSTPVVMADLTHVRQILINLISNAIKFAPAHSTITVGAQPAPRHALDLFVRDEGPGIPRAQQRAIFDPFKRLDPPAGQPRQCTGLGLAFVKEFAHLHGGKAWVQSGLGHGCIFWVRLPAGR